MKNPGLIHRSGGFARWIVIAVLVAIVLLVVWAVIHYSAEKVVRRQQAALLQGIEKRSAARISRLMAQHYDDRWDFTRQDAVDTMLDAGSQFLVLVVRGEEDGFERDGKTATISMHLSVSGNPIGPVGNEVVRRVNSLKKPFRFTWEKQNFLPTSWRLVKLDNEDLPAELYGYRPGDIRRRMKEGF